ncbi:MFS general substrate transporter [Aulographum hederae CBS 113979]|uniref:MFS general substrate transporter n=1 Tax=Aulographum hederae CBS 113979 TaxID=1176131 RepID=A0A6G1GW18_9PEZI|nr:MFS general substrate transporter [Aulographum hederae CBS 113979]
MSSHAFGAILDIQGQSSKSDIITDPPAVLPKSGITSPSPIELDEYQWGQKYTGPSSHTGHKSGGNTGYQTPRTPNELEMSRPPSPRLEDASELVQSWSNPPMNKWRVLACCLSYTGTGLLDSAPGALIPYMEAHYDIGYATVSLIFITNAIGFILAAFFNDAVLQRLGRAKSLMLSEVVMSLALVVVICAPPFPVVVTAFLFIGLPYSMILAMNNVFCANLADSTVILGAAHGSYGIGGILGPIMATALASNGILWSRFYIITLGVRLLTLVFAGWAFWNYEKEAPSRLLSALERTASQQLAVDNGEPSKRKLLVQALKNRVTIMGALFIFAYQGAEVSISGWVISFLISVRHGDPAQVGYVTAGFWGGITVGRFVLSHAAPRIGEKRFVYLLGLGTIAFQILVWFVPNIIGDAVAVAIVGLLLGPIYPCGQTVFARLLPRNIQMTSIGFIASAGSSGGAIAPFLTGLLAQAVGTFVMHPICIGLFVLMLACWFGLPAVQKRKE